MSDPLLKTRGKKPAFQVGDRVRISPRTGEWGADNVGTVQCVAEKPDAKGRFFVGVHMDGFPEHVGKPECDALRFVQQKPGKPPLPAFEAGLVTAVEA